MEIAFWRVLFIKWNLVNPSLIMKFLATKSYKGEAVVVDQLPERSLLTPEIRSSNPVIGKILYSTYSLWTVEKKKIKNKGRQWAILKHKNVF